MVVNSNGRPAMIVFDGVFAYRLGCTLHASSAFRSCIELRCPLTHTIVRTVDRSIEYIYRVLMSRSLLDPMIKVKKFWSFCADGMLPGRIITGGRKRRLLWVDTSIGIGWLNRCFIVYRMKLGKRCGHRDWYGGWE